MRRTRILVAGLLVATGIFGASWLVRGCAAGESRRADVRGVETPRPGQPSTPSDLAPAPPSGPGAGAPKAREPATKAPTAPRSAKGGGPVHGTVVDDERKPVAHATIRVVGDPIGAPGIESRDDGTFDLPDRGHRIAVFVAASGLVMGPDVRGWLEREGRNEIRLLRGAPLRITVVSAKEARPVRGAIVRSIGGDVAWSARHARPSDEAVTDVDGLATVLVPPGRAYVTVEAAGFATTRSPAIEVEDAGADQRVGLEVSASIEGRVVDAADEPVASATLRLVAGDLYERVAVTKADGRFLLDGVPAGSTPVALSVRGAGLAPFFARLGTIGPAEVRRMDVHLTAPRALDVRCLASDGTPVDGVDVSARPSGELWEIIEGRERSAARGRSGPDGRVRLEPVATGDWIVDGWSREDEFGFDTTTVSVAADAPVGSALLRRPPRESLRTLRVTVLDAEGKPVAEASLVLRGVFGPPSAPTESEETLDEATTDSRGEAVLSFRGMIPTWVLVFAKGFACSIHPVTAVNVDHGAFELRLSGRRARLRFVRVDGTPASLRVELETHRKARIDPRAFDDTPVWSSPDLPTDADGFVTFGGLGDLWYRPRIAEGGLILIDGPTTFQAGADLLVWTVAPEDERDSHRTPIHLVDAASEEAVRNARIVIVDSGEFCSDDVGIGESEYLSPVMSPGEHDLDVFVDGFVPVHVPRVALAGASKPVGLRLALDRGATISGVVRDADGRPFPGLSVQCRGAFDRDAATTDAGGEFTIPGLEGGAQTLVVSSPVVARTVEQVVRAEVGKVVRVDWVIESAGAIQVATNTGRPHGAIWLSLRDAARSAVVREYRVDYLNSGDEGYNPDVQEIQTFEALPPARYWLDVVWDGVPERSIPVDVRLGRTTTVTLSQP